jgi:CheY-like chemotaxis protein
MTHMFAALMKSVKPVLIVEDEEGIREILKTAIQLEGYPVFTAPNGEDALRLLREMPAPGLILLDLMMPVLNGWEFVERIEKDPKFSSIPAVALTAYAERAKSLKHVRSVLTKPIDFLCLMETVRGYCG